MRKKLDLNQLKKQYERACQEFDKYMLRGRFVSADRGLVVALITRIQTTMYLTLKAEYLQLADEI